jgi:membrane-bound ClpP family serine protease
MTLTYSIALLVLFFILLAAEFFIPSAGLVGAAAAVAAAASIAIAFTHSTAAGFSVIATIAVSTPLLLYAMVRYWPHSPIGRMILNRRPGQVDEPVESRVRSGELRKQLVGRIGVAKTNLLPAGLVVIDGQRLDAVSDGTPIDAGTQIVVINSIAGKLRVREAGPGDLAPEDTAVQRRSEALETTLESLDLDGLDEDT